MTKKYLNIKMIIQNQYNVCNSVKINTNTFKTKHVKIIAIQTFLSIQMIIHVFKIVHSI